MRRTRNEGCPPPGGEASVAVNAWFPPSSAAPKFAAGAISHTHTAGTATTGAEAVATPTSSWHGLW